MSEQSLKDKKEVKHRDSNLELYRIIVMLAIVAHHYVVNSGVMSAINADGWTTRSVFYLLFGMWGKTGINCFVLITGYYMCTSQITLRKFLKLLLQVEFYNIVIYAIFVLMGYEQFSVKEAIKGLWLVQSVTDGFTACFLLFYLTIPFMNILIKGMSRKMHLLLVSYLLFIYSFLASMPMITVKSNYVVWFSVLYFLASYIRLYQPRWIRYVSHLGGAFLLVAISMLSVVGMHYVNTHSGLSMICTAFVADSYKMLALMTSVSLFLYFKNMKIAYSNVINTIASTTFGVLCIHANSDTMRQWLWRDVVDCIGHYTIDYYYLYALMAVLLIFSVCSLIDYVRIHTVEKWMFRVIDKLDR